MRTETAVFHRDHRLFHNFGDLIAIEPFAKTGPQFGNLGAITCMHQNGLRILGGSQFFVTGQGTGGKDNRQTKEQCAQKPEADPADYNSPGPSPQP